MIDKIQAAFTVVGVVVTGATCIVAGLEHLAGITPTTKDDILVSKIKRVLGVVSAVLDKFSVVETKK